MRALGLVLGLAVVLVTLCQTVHATRAPFSSVSIRVRRALGEGCPGSSQELALAELMRSDGARFLRKHVRSQFEALFSAGAVLQKQHKAPAGYNPDDEDALESSDRLHFSRTLDEVVSVLGPKVHELLSPDVSIETIDLSNYLASGYDNYTIRDVVDHILVNELRTRRILDAARTAVQRRVLEVRQRHVLQLEQMVGIDTAATLQDAILVQVSHRNMTSANEEMRLRAHARSRTFAQMRSSLRRMHHAELQVMRTAGRYALNVVMSKAAILEDAVARLLLELVQALSNDGEGADHVINVARQMVRHSYELNKLEAKFLSAAGAMCGAVSLAVEQTLHEFFRDALMAVNAESYTNLAVSVATTRRLARTLSHRAQRELHALHDTSAIVREARQVIEIEVDRANKLLREQDVIIAGDLHGVAYNIFDDRPFNFSRYLNTSLPLPTVQNVPTFVSFNDRINRVSELMLQEGLDETWTVALEPIPVTHTDFERVSRLSKAIRFMETAEANFENARDSFRVGKDDVASTYLASGLRATENFLRLPDRIRLPTPPPISPAALREEELEFGSLHLGRKNRTRVFRLGPRARIFRHGVANDARPIPRPVEAVRSRLERLQWVAMNRTIPGRFSRFTLQLMRGVQQGELSLAERAARANGELSVKMQRERINLFRFFEREDEAKPAEVPEGNASKALDSLLEEISLGHNPTKTKSEDEHLEVVRLEVVPLSPLDKISVNGALLRRNQPRKRNHTTTQLQRGEDLTRAGMDAVRQITAGFLVGNAGGLPSVIGGVSALAQTMTGPIRMRLERILARLREMQRSAQGERRLGAAINAGATVNLGQTRLARYFRSMTIQRRRERAARVERLFRRRARDENSGIFRAYTDQELRDLRRFQRDQVRQPTSLADSLLEAARAN